MTRDGLLAPYLALDLTDHRGFLCGKVLADLGARVIKVEPPGGDPSRLQPPFFHDQPHPEASLFWFAYNQGKQSITLDLRLPRGRDLFLRLVERAHWVLESFPPGHLDSLGLGYPVLARANPGIILTSITPFGQRGPCRHCKGGDLVVEAMGGLVYLTGEPERPPARVGFPQAFLHASAQAAVASLLALHQRQRTGEGQWVDVSAQASVVPTTLNAPAWWELHRMVLRRQGTFRSGLSSGAVQRQTWPCRDGYVTFVIIAGGAGVKTNQAMVRWLEEEGLADDFLRGIDWEQFDMTSATQEFHRAVEERLSRLFLKYTSAQLYQEAMRRGIMLYPVATVADLARDPQLLARGFWTTVEHPELGEAITYPGAFVQGTPEPYRPGRRAPRIGEDNQDVYGGLLGLPPAEVAALRQEGVI